MAGNFFGGQFFGGGFFGAIATTAPSGGYKTDLTTHLPGGRRRRPEELSAERERFGIPDLAKRAIADVAARQAERLEQDKQRQFDELAGELKLRNLEWQTGYLEALAAERGRLIDAEIAQRLKQAIEHEDLLLLTLTLAAAV